VALAAGINGTVAAFAPGYDGTYVSVGTVAVVACLEGTVVGAIAAIAAMLLGPLTGGGALSASMLMTCAGAIGIAAVGRLLLRHPLTRTQPMAEGEAGLLIDRLQAELGRVRGEADAHRDAAAEIRRDAAAEVEAKQKSWREERQLVETSRGEALAAVDQLRTELQKAQRESERVRAAAQQREEKLIAAAAAERERLERGFESGKSELVAEVARVAAALESAGNELEAAAGQLGETKAEIETLREQHARMAEEIDGVRTQLAFKAGELEELRASAAADERRSASLSAQSSARIRELEEQLAQLGPELDRARSATAEEARRRAADAAGSREREGRLLAQYEDENAALQREVESAAETLRAVIAERDELQRQAEQDLLRTTASAREHESLRQMASDRASDAGRNADFRREAEERLASSQRDVRAMHDRIEELQRAFEGERRRVAEATAAVVTRESDVRRDLESRLAAAEESAAALRKHAEELESDVNAERIRSVEEKNALETRWSEKLQSIVSNLASDHETDVGNAVSDREAARAETRHLTARLQEAQRLAQQANASRAGLDRDLAAMRAALEEERSRAAAERTELESKLQQMVPSLASDHELDAGGIMEQREAARAEALGLASRLEDAQKAFDDSTHALAAMNHELRTARIAVDEERARADDEKRARERLDGEWSDKLQNIVTHLASDHEADIGQATVEKEAAKAEARSLTMRLASVQQAVESEREAFRNAQAKWTSIRESLLDKMQKAEERYRKLLEKQRQEHQSEREAIESELRMLKTGERPFTPEEIAAIRNEPFGPTEPMPAMTEELPLTAPDTHEERKPLILIVHHNPALRAMTKEALNGTGYDVLTAADGAEGLRMTKSHKPDIVIADVAMPKMDGRELCQAIKGNAETAATKVVLMAGMYTNEIPTSAVTVEIPPDDILRKPVKPEVLKASVSGLLGKAVAAS
jgi:CheY-like chemotaxis protein